MSAATLLTGALRRKRDLTHVVPYYTGAVSIIGLAVALYAATQPISNWGALAIFTALAIGAEVAGVDLYISSHSRISVTSVISIAVMATVGPWAGVLMQVAVWTAAALAALRRSSPEPKREGQVSWAHRTAFNISMAALSVAAAGIVYIGAGAQPGEIAHLYAVFPLILATAASYFVNLLLIILVVHFQTGRRLRNIWKRDFRWAMPIEIASGIIGGGGLAFAYEVADLTGILIFVMPVIATAYAFRLYVSNSRGYVEALESMNHRLEEANVGLLQTLGAVIDAYDIYTYGHSNQVARYAKAIAAELRLSDEEQAKIFKGGLIHDVGKVGVTDAIIGKPGKLTDEEYDALKRHTTIGAEIVAQMPNMQELVSMVRSHHERWDGRGYPDGLRGETIPFEARILAVADTVDAMLSDRPYRSTRTLASVVCEVERCSGKQFDPLVVNAFLNVVRSNGPEFFVNSAAAVATELERKGVLNNVEGYRYVKKSMLCGAFTRPQNSASEAA